MKPRHRHGLFDLDPTSPLTPPAYAVAFDAYESDDPAWPSLVVGLHGYVVIRSPLARVTDRLEFEISAATRDLITTRLVDAPLVVRTYGLGPAERLSRDLLVYTFTHNGKPADEWRRGDAVISIRPPGVPARAGDYPGADFRIAAGDVLELAYDHFSNRTAHASVFDSICAWCERAMAERGFPAGVAYQYDERARDLRLTFTDRRSLDCVGMIATFAI